MVSIAAEVGVLALMIAWLPEVPLDTKLAKVVVVPDVNVVVVPAPKVRLLKVLVPVIAKVPAEFVTLQFGIVLLLDIVSCEVPLF